MNFFYSSMPEAQWIGNHRAALMPFNFIIWKVDQSVRADNEVSKIIRISEQPPMADKSALAAINRALRVATPIHDIPGISLKFILTRSDGHGKTPNTKSSWQPSIVLLER
jgi:hypothetical protein